MNHSSNGKLGIAFYYLVVLGGLMIITGASAQQVTTNNLPSQQQTNVATLSVPASNRIVLSTVAGKVRVLDSKGLLLESNLTYLPRIKISDLSDSDLHSLLETKAAYAALTVFGPINERTAQSAVIENQLRQVWVHGKSLSEKIQTRILLLDNMRAYNANVAYLPGLTAGADDATARANWANDRQAARNQAASDAADGLENTEDARADGAASRQQVHDAWSDYREANESAARADDRANAANDRAAAANQSLQSYLNACATISGTLAAYGINVPGSPPFYRLPPLSMRPEVDAERAAGRSSTISSTTGQ